MEIRPWKLKNFPSRGAFWASTARQVGEGNALEISRALSYTAGDVPLPWPRLWGCCFAFPPRTALLRDMHGGDVSWGKIGGLSEVFR